MKKNNKENNKEEKISTLNTIFVQMASYRDPQLIPTLVDMINHAKHPELLRVVVCWQHAMDETIEDFLDNGFEVDATLNRLGDSVHVLKKNGATVELIDIHYLKTKGACWARNKIQQHYNNEKYTLQLDSHHRFVDNFDLLLIEQLESVRDISPKPLLTTYVPSFNPMNDPAERVKEPWKMDFDRFIPEGTHFTRPSTIDDWKSRTKPMHARFYSAHFAFADGTFATEVQHDPNLFFHGEEVSIGVRAYTHGYDMYHPNIVICWHEFTRAGRTKVWDDFTSQQKQKGKITEDWWEMNVKSHKRNRILFGMDGEDQSQIDFGKYGFGTVRTVKDFEEFSGVSFKYRGVQQCVLDRTEPQLSGYKHYDSEEEWKATITKSNDIRVCINKNDITWHNPETDIDEPYPDLDFDFCYVGAHDENDKEIHRKDLSEQELFDYLSKGDWIDYRFIYFSEPDKTAKTYVMWPHSKSKGWLNRIVRYADS